MELASGKLEENLRLGCVEFCLGDTAEGLATLVALQAAGLLAFGDGFCCGGARLGLIFCLDFFQRLVLVLLEPVDGVLDYG